MLSFILEFIILVITVVLAIAVIRSKITGEPATTGLRWALQKIRAGLAYLVRPETPPK